VTRRGAATGQLPLLAAAELAPAATACQRWTGGTHRWRRRRDGGFDQARYHIRPIGDAVAKPWVVREHYPGSFPASRWNWGLYVGEELLGVAVLGIPSHPAVLTRVFPDLQPFLSRGIPSTHWYCTPGRRPVGLPSHRRLDPLVPAVKATTT
jgi:hypothetical protein